MAGTTRASGRDPIVTRPRQNPSAGFLWALAVLLAIGHALLAVTATAGKSVTADEIAHVVAGHSYNIRHDFRLQPENASMEPIYAPHVQILGRVVGVFREL